MRRAQQLGDEYEGEAVTWRVGLRRGMRSGGLGELWRAFPCAPGSLLTHTHTRTHTHTHTHAQACAALPYSHLLTRSLTR